MNSNINNINKNIIYDIDKTINQFIIDYYLKKII